MALETKPSLNAKRVPARPAPRSRNDAPSGGPAIMRLWARHWLRTCREVPSRAAWLLERMERNPERRVHDFRRLMKAWRSLLKLAPAALAKEAKAMRGEIKQLRQSFGAARDATVVARTLAEVLPGRAFGPVEPPEPTAVARTEIDAACARLDRLSSRMAGWSVAAEGGGFLLAAFRQTYRKARRRARHDDVREMDLEHLHAWRTAVIDLGYQLSFFKPADPATLEAQTGAAERLRSHLGTVVDLDMARAHLAETVPLERLAGAKRAIRQGIVKRRRKAARIARNLLGERPRTLCAHLAKGMAMRGPRRVRLA